MWIFTKTWWKYIFEKPEDSHYTNWLNRIWCRWRGHPAGVWWYNVNRYEPDMYCKNCGDDLG